MWPLLISSGRDKSLIAKAVVLASFNVAAADQQRKGNGGEAWHGSTYRFNVAAADQQRKGRSSRWRPRFGGASMWPLLISSGRLGDDVVPSFATFRFNVAAADQQRKGVCSNDMHGPLKSFNVAAADQQRKAS